MECRLTETFLRRLGAGQCIFRAGDIGKHFYVIKSGLIEFRQVDHDGKEVVLRRAGPGELFGEIALIEDVPRTADAVVVSDVAEVLEIDHARFVYLVSQQPAFAIMVMQVLAQRLRHREGNSASVPPSMGRVKNAEPKAGWRRLRDNIYYIAGKPGGRGCNVYLVRGSRRNVLIDAGLPYDFSCLQQNLEAIGLAVEDIDMVLLTHEHIDHIGSAPYFPTRTIFGAHQQAANKIGSGDDFVIGSGFFDVAPSAFHVDMMIPDETAIDLGDCTLRALHTPGHVSGSMCFYQPEQQLLFTGDMISAGGILGGIFPSGSISDYTASLRRLHCLRIDELFPGHGLSSKAPIDDIEGAIGASQRLAEETGALFAAMNHGNSFAFLMQGTAAYARRAGSTATGSSRNQDRSTEP